MFALICGLRLALADRINEAALPAPLTVTLVQEFCRTGSRDETNALISSLYDEHGIMDLAEKPGRGAYTYLPVRVSASRATVDGEVETLAQQTEAA